MHIYIRVRTKTCQKQKPILKTKQVRGPGNLRAMGKYKVLWKCTYKKNVSCLVPYAYVRYFCWNIYRGCLPFIKKNPEILVGNFRSVRTVRVVYHLPKISWLSRRARLDVSYNLKLVRNSRNFVNGKRISIRKVPIGKTGLPFQNFRLFLEFSSGTNQKNVYYLHPNRHFREFVVNGKQPELRRLGRLSVIKALLYGLGLSTHFTD